MSNEEFQILMLKKMDSIDTRLEGIETRLGSLEHRMDKLEHRMDKLEHRMDKLERRMDSFETNMNLLSEQVKENTQVLKALVHSSEVNKAEHDTMMVNIAHITGDTTRSKEDIRHLEKDISAVETITAINYNDIVRLKTEQINQKYA